MQHTLASQPLPQRLPQLELPPHLSAAYRNWRRLRQVLLRAEIQLDGYNLDIGTGVAIAISHGLTPKLSFNPAVVDKIESSVQVLTNHLNNNNWIYGANIGFGDCSDSQTDFATSWQSALPQFAQTGILISSDKEEKQRGLLGPHVMPPAWVRASIIFRVNSSARGHSGISLPVLESLIGLLQNNVTPMEKTQLSLQMFGKLLFSQATELDNPNYNNGLPINFAADDSNISFTIKGFDISMSSYMAELAYLANPVSSYVQIAELHNQAINSMAFVSSRYTMQAAEVVSYMAAYALYINCQALDLHTLHLSFLDQVKKQLHMLLSKI